MTWARADIILVGLSLIVFLGTLVENIFRLKRESRVEADLSIMKRQVKRKIVSLSIDDSSSGLITKTMDSMRGWVTKKRTVGAERVNPFLEVKQREKKAEVHLRRGEHELAEKYLVEALSFDSTNEEINKKLALLYLNQKKFPKAELIYLRLIEQGSNDATVYSNLGLVLYHEGRLDLAVKSYQKAIELDPKRPARYANIGQIYYQLQDMKNAILFFEQAYQLNKKEVDYMFILAKLYEEISQKEKAKFYYHKILDVDPYNAEAKEGIRALL